MRGEQAMMPSRKTALVAGLLLPAILLPTCAWFIASSRELEHTIEAAHQEAIQQLEARATTQAARLERRLEQLRSGESTRPFFHYQNLFHDPRGAAQGLAVTPSPLVSGTFDPLIEAHFQINEQGQVSLPTVNDQFPELSAEEGFAVYCDFLAAMQSGVVLDHAVTQSMPSLENEQTMVIERSQWEQNVRADAVYAMLTGNAVLPSITDAGDPDASVKIRVGPLQWQTLTLASGSKLVALREVATPLGTLVQGFAPSLSKAAEWLELDPRELSLQLLDNPTSDTDFRAPVGETCWALQTHSAPILEAVEVDARAMTRRFHTRFALLATALLLTAGAVVAITAQTDRLAAQRARFATTAAHELKTPLSSLRLYSEMLAEGLGNPTRTASYASQIATEASRLSRVVTNMLDLSRLERGAALAHPQLQDPAHVLRECLAQLHPALEDAGLALDQEVPATLQPVMVDTDALCQILCNLLDNAEKHTRGTAHRSVTVRAVSEAQGIRITVSDNGPGLRGSGSRLFSPLSRSRHRSKHSGLGLGLPLARSLARAQGGDLVIDHAPGLGAQITVVLPRPSESPSRSRS